MVKKQTPVKVPEDTGDLIRYGAGVFECSQGEFVARCVADYLERAEEIIERKVAEKAAQAREVKSRFREEA